jgi:hypothetical protein
VGRQGVLFVTAEPKPQVITDTNRILLVHEGWAVGSIYWFGGATRTLDLEPMDGSKPITLDIRPLSMTTLDLATGAKIILQIGCAVLPHARFNFSDMVPCMWGRFCPGGTRLPAPDAVKLVDAGGERRLIA